MRTPLFDGKSFRGWTTPEGKPVPDGWEVVDGMIHRRAKAGDIVTEKHFGEFVLTFEWKLAPGCNSGLKYHVGLYDGNPLGLEYQLIDDPKLLGKADKHATGALYDLVAPDPRVVPSPPGQWNRSEIRVKANRIEHYLNGKRLLAISLGSPEWQRALGQSKFRTVPEFGMRPGPILLQDHGGELWLKNLWLTE